MSNKYVLLRIGNSLQISPFPCECTRVAAHVMYYYRLVTAAPTLIYSLNHRCTNNSS